MANYLNAFIVKLLQITETASSYGINNNKVGFLALFGAIKMTDIITAKAIDFTHKKLQQIIDIRLDIRLNFHQEVE